MREGRDCFSTFCIVTSGVIGAVAARRPITVRPPTRLVCVATRRKHTATRSLCTLGATWSWTPPTHASTVRRAWSGGPHQKAAPPRSPRGLLAAWKQPFSDGGYRIARVTADEGEDQAVQCEALVDSGSVCEDSTSSDGEGDAAYDDKGSETESEPCKPRRSTQSSLGVASQCGAARNSYIGRVIYLQPRLLLPPALLGRSF